jgi:hypothetical protein
MRTVEADMQPFLAAGSVALLLLSTTPSFAEITLEVAEYEAGILRIEGRTSHPNGEISLDGRFAQKANQFGAFEFRIEYLPNDCTISLFDGEDTRTAAIQGCRVKDALDVRPEPGATESTKQ